MTPLVSEVTFDRICLAAGFALGTGFGACLCTLARTLPSIESLLRRYIKHDNIGFEEVGEKFTRYTMAHNRYFRLFIHQMHAPVPPPVCHDHPWSFVSLILNGGYWESEDGKEFVWRRPGSILYRRAEFAHTVKTAGPEHRAWSVVIAGPYRRQWGSKSCPA